MVHRDGLVARLDAGAGRALRMVVGSPGSGKTSLLADWFTRQPEGRAAWLNADEGDRDPARFWQATIAAVRRHVPDFGEEALDLLTLEGTVDQDVLESLLADGDALGRTVAVVVDDFQLVGSGVHQHLRFLAGRRMAGLQLVIGSRAEPALGLERLRLHGDLCEVREADLRLGPAETAKLVARLEVTLAPEDLAVLQRQTEGWAAGVQLATVALRESDEPHAFVSRLAATAQVISQYLAAELVDTQPPEVQRFLLDTSIVDELTPGLAAALSPDVTVSLPDLEARNLLLVRLDPKGEAFRYHPLFAEMLRYRLLADDPRHEHEVHRRAARWYRSTGDPVAAFRHAWRAGDRTDAMEQLHGHVVDAYFAGRRHAVADAAATLTDADLRAAPGPAVSVASALNVEGRPEAAEDLAVRIASLLGTELAPDELVQLLSTRMMSALATGRPEDAIALGADARDLVARHGVAGEWVDGALAVLVRAYAWADRCDDGEAVAAELPLQGPEPIRTVEQHAAVALLRCEQGRLDEAAELARASVAALGERSVEADLPATAVSGTVLLERGETAAAREALQRVSAAGSAFRRPIIVMARVGLSRLWLAEGALEPALLVLEDARALITDAPPTGALRTRIDAQAARVLLAAGDLTGADALIASLATGARRSTLEAWSLLAHGRPERARAALRAVDPTGVPLPVRLGMALAEVACELAEEQTPTSATEAAEAALTLAAPERFVFAIPEAGADVLDALCAVARRRPRTTHTDALLRTRPHAVATDRPTIDLAIDALSERERTVLRYLVTSMSYREIADELYVSVNTVKTHVKNIIRKLHADGRAQAIERARELHYL